MVQNLRSPLIQPTASSSRGLSWPRSLVLSLSKPRLTFGRESVSINTVKRCPRLAEAVNDCCACSVFYYIPDLHGWETRAAVAGKWPAAGETEILSKLHIIHMHPWNIAFKPLDWSLTNFSSRFPRKFRKSPNANLERNVNLKRKII